jgi:4-carboxymuconolactone decarboxylase
MRIDALAPEQMNAAQRRVYDEAVSGKRGQAPVPLLAWIHSPALAGHAQRLGEAIRFEVSLPPRVVALAALMIAAHWRSPHILLAQEAKLRAAGIPATVLARLAAGKLPALEDTTDIATYTVVRMLLDKQELDDTTYALAIAAFGQQGVVELVTTAGYYTMVAMTLKTFQIDGGGETPR